MTLLYLTLVLLVAFQIKHFLADYLLQTPYMLQKFSPGWDFVLPLLAHVSIHALFTFNIAMSVLMFRDVPFLSALGIAGFCGLVDGVIHFLMDRVKAGPAYLGRYKALSGREYSNATSEEILHNKIFWIALGLDQMVHHFTHYAIIAFLVLA
jgi:hypothetical protein